jgi:hypothetical protein
MIRAASVLAAEPRFGHHLTLHPFLAPLTAPPVPYSETIRAFRPNVGDHFAESRPESFSAETEISSRKVLLHGLGWLSLTGCISEEAASLGSGSQAGAS